MIITTDLIQHEPAGCSGVKMPRGRRVHCGKLPVPGSSLCPHCEVLTDHLAGAPSRRAAKAQRTKEARIAEEEFLKNSPLAAVNPDFERGRKLR